MRYSDIILFLIVSFVFLYPSLGNSQVTLTHGRNLSALCVDTIGQLIVTDEDENHFKISKYKFQKLEQHDGTYPESTSGFRIQFGQLVKYSGDRYSYIPLPFEPLSICEIEDYHMLSSESALWMMKDGKTKRYFIPGVDFPKAISHLVSKGSYLSMLTRGKDLYLYDTVTQIIDFVDRDVDHMAFDGWQSLWYTSKNSLHHDNAVVSERPPNWNKIEVVDGSNIRIQPPYMFSKDEKDVKLSFSAAYPPLMDDVTYAYRVDDEDWQEIGSQQSIRIQNLPKGRHDIWIKAKGINKADAISQPLQIEITQDLVSKFFPWLLGLIALMLLLGAYGQKRNSDALKDLKVQKEKVELELELISEKQKLGQAQMNPHFIFNTLNSISGLIALGEKSKARSALNKFSQMMRRVLDQSRNQKVLLSDEMTFLNDYLSLEQMMANDGFEYQINNQLKDDPYVAPMILQPFLENAIIHGFKGINHKGQLGIVVSDGDRHIKATIEDNGKGRQAAALSKSSSHDSVAVAIAKERLKALDRWAEVKMEYEDLMDKNGNPSGTRVVIHLPKLRDV